MIKSINKELQVNDLDVLINDLEARDELSCTGNACGANAGFCIGAVCGAYVGFCLFGI